MRHDSSSRSASRKSASRKTRGTYARQLGYESLEDRRLLATTAVWAGGTLTIAMPLPGDNGLITLVGTEYKVNGASVATAPGGTLEAAEFQRLVATGGAGAQALTIDPSAPLSLVNGFEVSDGLVEDVIIKAPVVAGADIKITSPTRVSLEANLGTTGSNVNLTGPVTLVGGARLIQTNLDPGVNAGNVTLNTVNSATAGQSLFIDARAATGFNGGAIKFNDIGTLTATPLTSFEAHTNGTGSIDFTGGDVIQTDGGPVVLEANTFELAGADDLIDTELGANDAGGAVNLSAINQIRYTGATLPHILTINTQGVTTQPAGAVTLNTTQFVQGATSGGFNNFNDATNNRVLIQVPVTTLFTEDFTSPTAFNRFASNFFTQTGTSFVASPPKGQKAIAIILPAQITPPLPLPNTFKLSTTATITTPPGRFKNGFLVFDAVDNKNFKFAGAFVGRKQFSVGEVKNGTVIHRNTSPITGGNTFNLSVAINAATGAATLSNGGTAVANFTFGAPIGQSNGVGVGTNNAVTSFTNISLIS